MKPQSFYLPHLDALRFLASMFVLIDHYERLRVPIGVDAFAIRNLGRCGYTLFFTLSGFLITTLLLKEFDLTGFISKKKFYFRRIIRIWPLYFAVVAFEYFTHPMREDSEVTQSLILTLFLLPNVRLLLNTHFAFASWTWAIGVHEQFYAFWPWLLDSKHRLRWVLGLTIAFMSFSIWTRFVYESGDFLYDLIFVFPYHLLGIGALFAILGHADSARAARVKDYLFHPISQGIILLSVVGIIVYMTTLTMPNFIPLSMAYGALILNLSNNPHCWIRLEHPLLNYLGLRSYSFFMIQIFILRYLFINRIEWGLNWTEVYMLGIAATILFSEVTYQMFERPFVKWKRLLGVVEKNR